MKKDGEEPYPHKFNVTISLEEFIEKFSSLAETQILHDEKYSVAGIFDTILTCFSFIIQNSKINYISAFISEFNYNIQSHSQILSYLKIIIILTIFLLF